MQIPKRIAAAALLLAGSMSFAALTSPAAGLAPAARPALSGRVTLLLGIADIMRASIEVPANGLWAAAGEDTLSEDEWQLADQDAVNLIAGTTLLAAGGTGKSDAKWVSSADWQAWILDQEKTALNIRAAVMARDQKTLAAAADHLQEICAACHSKYRPQTATDGLSRYPFYPKRELPR